VRVCPAWNKCEVGARRRARAGEWSRQRIMGEGGCKGRGVLTLKGVLVVVEKHDDNFLDHQHQRTQTSERKPLDF
jgi:hypothetical protein